MVLNSQVLDGIHGTWVTIYMRSQYGLGILGEDGLDSVGVDAQGIVFNIGKHRSATFPCYGRACSYK